MAEHAPTPTPWSVGDHRRSIVRDVPDLADGYDHYNIAVLSSHSLLGLEEAYANAELIVQAVNNHEVLLAAAERVCWFDWSDNDRDAAAAVEELRRVVNAVVGGSGT